MMSQVPKPKSVAGWWPEEVFEHFERVTRPVGVVSKHPPSFAASLRHRLRAVGRSARQLWRVTRPLFRLG